MAQVNIKQLSINDEIVNVYLYISEDKNQIMLAIPDIFWSIELDLNMDSNDVKEELVMQLFAFIEENEAIKIASNLTNWIVNDARASEFADIMSPWRLTLPLASSQACPRLISARNDDATIKPC